MLAEEKIRQLFSCVSIANVVESSNQQALNSETTPDIVMDLETPNASYSLIVEVKSKVQPRMIPTIAAQLRTYQRSPKDHLLVFSEFVSERSAAVCQQYDLNYLDEMGNCRISLPDIYIEKVAEGRKVGESRTLKSLFSLKSSRVINVLLNHPGECGWQISELAETCGVSLGLVSNIKKKLIEQGFADEDYSGIWLIAPGELLRHWRSQYSRKVERRQGFYTLMNPAEKDDAIQRSMRDGRGHLALSGFSAARWIAPFAKSTAETFYVDEDGEKLLVDYLQLEAVESGANVILERPQDDYLVANAIATSEGKLHTDPVQTYLDLSASGERGEEAADFLMDTFIADQWRGS